MTRPGTDRIGPPPGVPVTGRLLLMAMWLAGCATYVNPVTGRPESLLISTPAEVSLGQMAAAQLQAQWAMAPRPPPAEVARVARIGAALAAVVDRRDLVYRFHVVPERTVNAFTVLGGDIYVHAGLTERSTDDELACVLAHELGHAAARHGVKGLQARLGYSILMEVAFGGAQTMTTDVLDTAFGLVSRGFSRQDELQADLLAVRYAARAGFNPRGLITFLQQLQAEQGEGPAAALTVYWRTHPLYRDRIAQAEQEIARQADGGPGHPAAPRAPR